MEEEMAENVEAEAEMKEEEEEEEKKDVREGSVDLDELYKNELWFLSSKEIESYHQFFISADLNKDGFISGYEANLFFKEATLDRKQLRDIWTLCDHNRNGKISEAMFYVMFHIFYAVSKSESAIPIPNKLPKCLTYQVIEKMRLDIQLRASKENKQQALADIEKFKEEQQKKRDEMLAHIKSQQNRINRNIPKTLTKEEIKENKRSNLANVYGFNRRNWYFNDELGDQQGPYDIHSLIECWKNNEIEYGTELWKTNERYKTEKLSSHKELYEYICLFAQYKWYYLVNERENGPYLSYRMRLYVLDGIVDNETKIRREPPFDGDNENVYKLFLNTYIYDIWSKSITKSDHKNEGFLIQDTASMFLHNLCYYYFAVNIFLDNMQYENNTLGLIANIAIAICAFESILMSLGQFELKERLIPFKNLLMPIAVIQLILEWFVNLPMIILEIYYLYFIKWNKDIFNDKINNSIYVSFIAYILHNFYKIGVIHLHHFYEFRDNTDYSSPQYKQIKRSWRCCNLLHILNWAVCVPVVLIIFGAVFFNNHDNDYTLSLVLVILGSVLCCCLTCIGAISANNL